MLCLWRHNSTQYRHDNTDLIQQTSTSVYLTQIAAGSVKTDLAATTVRPIKVVVIATSMVVTNTSVVTNLHTLTRIVSRWWRQTHWRQQQKHLQKYSKFSKIMNGFRVLKKSMRFLVLRHLPGLEFGTVPFKDVSAFRKYYLFHTNLDSSRAGLF